MKSTRFGLVLAVKEHLAAGNPITRLDALVLYGLANLPAVITDLRRQGWIVESRLVTYASAATRINRNAVLKPPANLPAREVFLTEYWVSK